MKAYQFKITIKDTHPPIWRRVIVPAGLSFNQLTLVLNEAMGWCGYHLSSYTFQSLGLEFEDDPEDDFSMWSDNEILDAAEYIIDEFVESVKSFTYIYDFGDNWAHQVQVEKIIYDYEYDYPQVIKFKGGCPLEDCGGVWGFYELMETLNDPKDPEYDYMMEWSGGSADSEYNLESVNAILSTMKFTGKTTKPMSKDEIYHDYFDGKPLKKIKAQRTADPFSSDVLYFPGLNKKSAFDDADELAEFDDLDDWDDDYEDIQELIAFVTDMTLSQVIDSLKRNTKMNDKEIMKALDLDEEYYAILIEDFEE